MCYAFPACTMAFAWCEIRALDATCNLECRPHSSIVDVLLLLCRTESEAEDFIGGSAERLWALVVFDSGPDDNGAGIRVPPGYLSQLCGAWACCAFMTLSYPLLSLNIFALLAEYTIRMNFTTVPRTWISVNKWRHSVPIHYKVSHKPPASPHIVWKHCSRPRCVDTVRHFLLSSDKASCAHRSTTHLGFSLFKAPSTRMFWASAQALRPACPRAWRMSPLLIQAPLYSAPASGPSGVLCSPRQHISTTSSTTG